MATYALDFDGTFTGDPELWSVWAKMAISRGHVVKCITFRPHDKMQKVYDQVGPVIGIDNIVSTNGQYKKSYTESIGISIDVWIDDNPEMIVTEQQVTYWHNHVRF